MPTILKGDGTREAFDVSKLERSLRRAGAPSSVVSSIANVIAKTVRDGMSTSDIYRDAFKKLHKEQRTLASRYSMRRALLDMGPSGYPFEDYFSELMRAKGYSAKVRQMVKGRCIDHEVDAILTKEGVTVGAELKFHNLPGFKTDLKTALYVRARFSDIEQAAQDEGRPCEMREAWLVTNTKFTGNAVQYAQCAGITLLGWNVPFGAGLADLIEETGLYPVTALTSISRKEEAQLLQNQITLCRDIAARPETLTAAGITKRKHAVIIAESKELCGI